MKTVFFIFTYSLFIFTQYAVSQNINIKEGAYRSIVDFHKNQPFVEDVQFTFTAKPKKHIYRVSTKSRKVNSKLFNFGTWAIYQDSTFYINLERLGMGKGFVKILELGRHSFFKGTKTMTASQNGNLIKNELHIGSVQPSFIVANINKTLGVSDLYLLDLKNGMHEKVDLSHMKLILRNEKDLYNQYLLEPEKKTLNIMLLYVKKLNERLPLF